MEKASVCTSCQERTHSASKCPLLWEMLKDEFYKGSGKGGGDAEDDAVAPIASGKAFKHTSENITNELISKNPYQ